MSINLSLHVYTDYLLHLCGQEISKKYGTTECIRLLEVLIASFFTDDQGCAHENREHTLIYLCSGELEIEERGKINGAANAAGAAALTYAED